MTALERYKSAAQKLADLTRPKCEQCRTARSTRCCAYEHCMLTAMFMEDYAARPGLSAEIAPFLEHWQERNANPELDETQIPFMSDKGCVVPPHLRPQCTAHHCDINSIGVFKTDLPATDEWFALYTEMTDAFDDLVLQKGVEA